jgi:hypothetical protein
MVAKEMNERIRELHSEFANILNVVVGLLAFSLALGSLGSSQPGINAVLSALFMCLVYLISRKYFYEQYAIMRLNANTDLSVTVRSVKPLGMFQEFKATPVYFFGTLFLVIVMGADAFNFYLERTSQCPDLHALLSKYLYGTNK